MICKELQVTNKIGFHARPASMLIQAAKKHNCAITIKKGDKETNLESLVSLLKLRVKCGDWISLSAEGSDEERAIDELITLIGSKFGEN